LQKVGWATFWAIFSNSSGHPELEQCSEQDDQIGRIFACWAAVYLGQFFFKYKSSQITLMKILAKHFWAIFHKLTWSPDS
jgi:hypothetical protein